MALPFLPADQIANEFDRVRSTVTQVQLQSLCDYVQSTRVNSYVWNVTVFKKVVRTNKDTESCSIAD